MNPAGLRRYGAGDWQFRTNNSPTNLNAAGTPKPLLNPGALQRTDVPGTSPGRPGFTESPGYTPNNPTYGGVAGSATSIPNPPPTSGNAPGSGSNPTASALSSAGSAGFGKSPVSQYTPAQTNQTWNAGGSPGVLSGLAYNTNAQFNNKVGANWNQGYVGPNGQQTSWPTGPGAPNYYSMYYGGSGGGAPGNNGPMGGSTDPTQYMSGNNYMYNLDLNAALQQANQVNYNKANNGPGAGDPYTQIDMGKFNSWYDAAMAALANGQDAPPQDFWINGPSYAQTPGNQNPSGYPGMPAAFGSTGSGTAGGAGGASGGATQMAEGGIVTKPTKAIIGENGPEAVVPLHPGPRARLDTGMLGGMAGNPVPTIRPHLSPRVGAPMPSPLRQARRYGTVRV